MASVHSSVAATPRSSAPRNEASVPFSPAPPPAAGTAKRLDMSDHAVDADAGSPTHKRRRTVKACANCRRRKIRCSGGEPCESCRLNDNVCFYESGGRMTATAYIQSLERKLGELESLLSGRQDQPGAGPRSEHEQPEEQSPSERSTHSKADAAPSPGKQSDEDVIETMIKANDNGYASQTPGSTHDGSTWDLHHPSFAGMSLLRRVHNLCRHVSGQQHEKNGESSEDDFTHAFDIAPPDADSTISWESFALLPSREKIDQAIEVVVDQACCNMQFLDRQQLHQVVEDIFADTDGDMTSHARKPLALLYAILALGRRYDTTVPPAKGRAGNKAERTINGLRYFRASRALLDPANCQDVTSLRALLCMILFLQASSMLSTCYSYICMAVAAALQMGLFTDTVGDDLPDEQKLARQRIAAVLSMMDTFVTTALGLPRTLRDMEPGHALPTMEQPANVHDPLFGTYAHARLIQILAVTVENNHPVTRPIGQKNGFYGVEYSKIASTEDQLEQWFEQLLKSPPDPQNVEDARLIRSQLMLRMYYAHVQMVLYRPFLHHALKDVRQTSRVSMKAYACGSACIKASMQVVWLAERMEACNLFSAAHWFMTLIIAHTAVCLVLFVTSNRGDPTVDETAEAVKRIRRLCARHAQQNTSMRRCLGFLDSLPSSLHQDPNGNGEPSSDDEPWNSFTENINTFSEAFRASEEGTPQSDNMLQAHHLPQLHAFMNCRM